MRFTPVSPQQPMPTFSRLVSRMSAHSIAPSYYATNDYAANDSRSSVGSTTPMVSKSTVPTLGMPRVPSRAQQGLMVSLRLLPLSRDTRIELCDADPKPRTGKTETTAHT
jgi:hypothetical protein